MAAFTDRDTRRLEAQVKASEGYRLTAFHSNDGALTVGYGHDCSLSPVSGVAKAGDRIRPEQAESLFQKDLASTVWSIRRTFPWVRTLSPARQAVIYEVGFSMGIGVSGPSGLNSLNSLLRDMEAGDYDGASNALQESDWARRSSPRAHRLAKQLETGEWQ